MKTILPIPEQPRFRILLPERVKFACGTAVERTPTGMKLVRNGTTLAISAMAAAWDALDDALNERGIGLATSDLSVIWSQLLERLATTGMLVDAAHFSGSHGTVRSDARIPALNAVVTILDKIYEETLVRFPVGSAIDRFIAGEFDSASAVKWLIENYHYTKSASYHVAPMLQHDMDPEERELWLRFLKDESWHWRIYRPALHQFELTYAELDARDPLPPTRHLIETLHSIADKGPIAYAAAMIFIERPPLWTDLHLDPLYTSLMKFYGFSQATVRPLWWHATENLSAGHSALGVVVISHRRTLSLHQVDEAVAAVRDTIHAVSEWQEGILNER